MKSIYISIILVIFTLNAYSQTTYYPLVKGAGSGETSENNTTYSHHSNYTMRILNLTVKWDLSILFGEPVVNGVFKWRAASETPEDYLDSRDCILLECLPEKTTGYYVYIKLSPTVPKSGDGYGYNTPGSPSWANVFCTRKGENMTHEIAGFTASTAKAIWKNGFRVTGLVLLREGGKDGWLKPKSTNSDDFWDTPENTTTTQQQKQGVKQQEAVERQKQLTEQAKAKYNALKNPYTWNVNNRDTVTETSIQALKSLNSYFNNGTITISSVSKGKLNSTASDISSNLQLAQGWNTLRIALKGDNYNVRDSVKVYYKKAPKDSRFGTFTDPRDGNVYKTVKIGNQVWMAENLRYRASSGCWAYDNDESNAKIYGYLYDWNTAMRVCPPGWHLPTDSEWSYLNKISSEELKATTGWNEYKRNINGTNRSGFSAMPGGFRYHNNNGFDNIGVGGFWWSASKRGNYNAYLWYLFLDYNDIKKKDDYIDIAIAIRCIRN
ncbi:MAG: fibrobacter succinogenes major paralogous domain-containing protein [Bacteroidales bacterium]